MNDPPTTSVGLFVCCNPKQVGYEVTPTASVGSLNRALRFRVRVHTTFPTLKNARGPLPKVLNLLAGITAYHAQAQTLIDNG